MWKGRGQSVKTNKKLFNILEEKNKGYSVTSGLPENKGKRQLKNTAEELTDVLLSVFSGDAAGRHQLPSASKDDTVWD